MSRSRRRSAVASAETAARVWARAVARSSVRSATWSRSCATPVSNARPNQASMSAQPRVTNGSVSVNTTPTTR
jgi:hypothetical protein